MKKSLTALAAGTFALGIAEFVMMGILPDVATNLGITIPQAGHFIAAYALGVCVGAPLLALFARSQPLKRILLGLGVLVLIGNLCTALAPDYWVMLATRFISGLPHGAFFGVGSIVADKLADKGKGAQAISIMVAGMTVANVLGVPLGTTISHSFSWRFTFVLIALWSLVLVYLLWTGYRQYRHYRTPVLPDSSVFSKPRFPGSSSLPPHWATVAHSAGSATSTRS